MSQTEVKRLFDRMSTSQIRKVASLSAQALSQAIGEGVRHATIAQGGLQERRLCREIPSREAYPLRHLYLLYILRRRTSVNLEHVIDGLRVLHVVEALSIDSLVREIQAGSLSSQSDKALRKTLEVLFPELQGWNGADKLLTLPLIKTEADTPVNRS